MFAVVDILGQQFKVTENGKYTVPKLKSEKDSEVVFDSVLVYSDDKNVTIGNPSVKDIKVFAKVLDHFRDDKVIVFKKTRRKSYRVKNGHRQNFTKIEITKIGK